MRFRLLIVAPVLVLVGLIATLTAPADPSPARWLPAVEAVYAAPSPDYEQAWNTAATVELEAWLTAAAAVEAQRADEAAAAAAKAKAATTTTKASPGSGSHRGYATAKECVSMVENGGDYGRSTNPTHFGRYQFARSTWASFGGDPGTWGTATPAEQDAVFEYAWESGGSGHWLPYDHCG